VEVLRIKDNRVVHSGDFKDVGPQLSLTLPFPDAGLYLVSLTDRFDRKRGDVFISVVPAKSYQTVKAAYEQARSVSTSWNEPEGRDAAHLFLRAYLLALQEQQ
jgi:hypothetical protein